MPRHRKWSDVEIAKLNGLARRYPTAQIAAALGRGISSTVMKAYELRISLRMKAKRGSRLDPNFDPGPAGMDLKR
jgi:hypothetical protein